MISVLASSAGGLRRLAAAAALAVAGMAAPAAAALADTFVVPNPYATGLDNTTIRVDTLIAFGDSYTATNRKWFHNWAEQLTYDDKEITKLSDFGKSGATAGGFPPSTNDFSHQVKKWQATAPILGATDLTVVYFGYNDIDGGTDPAGSDLANSEADYKAVLKRVIGAGANSGGRRILLVMPHNWGRSPYYVRTGGFDLMRQRTQVWGGFAATTAQKFSNTYGNIVAVDLYTAMERVFQNPAAFCLTNTTTADPTNSATTALYDDDFHFGYHGQHLIKQVLQYYLTRGWDWSNTYKKPSQAQAMLGADLDAGKVFTTPCPPAPARGAAVASASAGLDRQAGFGRAWARHLHERVAGTAATH